MSSVCRAETPFTLRDPRKSQVTHAHSPPAVLRDERDRAHIVVSKASLLGELLQVQPVDEIDDLEMAREKPLQQRDRPRLQRLRQKRVVGIVQYVRGDVPRIGPRRSCSSTRIRISSGTASAGCVSLSCTAARSGSEWRSPFSPMGTHEILEGCRCEEVFLPEPKLPALRRIVARIEDLRDRIRARLGGLRLHVLPVIERIEFERLRCTGAPEAKQVGPAASPTDDQDVVRDRQDGIRRPPDMSDGVAFPTSSTSPELHRKAWWCRTNSHGTGGQPVVGRSRCQPSTIACRNRP